MGSRRLYPKKPIVGVGVLIHHQGRYLLIKRAGDPDAGQWSIPGGLVELGETVEDTAVREAREETGLEIEILNLIGVVDKIIEDDERRVKFHFLIINYLAEPISGLLAASSDALEVIWVKTEEFYKYDLTSSLVEFLKNIGIYF
jgi:mutator protein MutT